MHCGMLHGSSKSKTLFCDGLNFKMARTNHEHAVFECRVLFHFLRRQVFIHGDARTDVRVGKQAEGGGMTQVGFVE